LIEGRGSADFSLLPADRSFRDSLPAFALPYFAYVGLGTVLPQFLGPDLTQAVRFLVVLGLLLYFRRNYRFGPSLRPFHYALGLLFALVATGLWVATLRGMLALPGWSPRLAAAEGTEFSLLYAVLRTANSVLLVPIFEELLTRAFIPELLLPPRKDAEGRGMLDRFPPALSAPPLAAGTVAMAALLFALGHDLPSVLPAILYYVFTAAIYFKTRNFRLLILIHALTNLALAGLVFWRADFRYLWF
jgi:hypothetical protein